jgi:phosphatidylglycerol:prolipoprotein diacylglycerol transferase
VDVDDLIFFAAVGVIVGGRLGWILAYGFDTVVADPVALLRVWEGGMSFHGGLAGVMLAVAWFARRRGRRVMDVFDFTAPLPAVGLFAGRVGNFINGELWGKPTTLPWGIRFEGRVLHPSQLYEALLEGVVMFAVLWWFTSKPQPRLAPAGLFLTLYGAFRIAIEFVRLPDEHIGYLAFGWLTMGQLLSLPVLVAGVAMLAWAMTRREPSGNFA